MAELNGVEEAVMPAVTGSVPIAGIKPKNRRRRRGRA